MIIDYHILNKSKKKTIILLHGMFASGGFWLPYIKNFKSFRLVVLTIDYLNLLDRSQPDIEKELQSIFVKINPLENCIWICHSLGCSFFKVFVESKANKNFQICPVMLGKRRALEKFTNDIALIFNKPLSIVEEEARIIHSYMNNLLEKKKPLEFLNSDILIPSNDQYFFYPKSDLVFKQFIGDHYDIHHAIKYIKERL